MSDWGNATFVHVKTPKVAPPLGKDVEQYYAVVIHGLELHLRAGSVRGMHIGTTLSGHTKLNGHVRLGFLNDASSSCL